MVNISELSALCEKLSCTLETEVPLSDHITFRFGGPCRAFVSVSSAESAAEILRYLKESGTKYAVLGRGSNIIAADEGFDGVILHFGSDIAAITVDGTSVTAGAGAMLSSVCRKAQESGLTGMENLFGIPGTVGGALYMNAGAYGSEMKDIVLSAEYISEDCQLRTMTAEEMDLSYRRSAFSENGCIITSVTMGLSNGDPEQIKSAMNECMQKRTSKQPLEYPSAGSTFKRPEGSFASKLIDECGLKGLTVGGAMVSEKHAGFVINTGSATCADVLELCGKVAADVKAKTGFSLELEPVILK